MILVGSNIIPGWVMRRLCRVCRKRPAKTLSRRTGRIKQTKGHDMCRQCFESVKDRNRVVAKKRPKRRGA